MNVAQQPAPADSLLKTYIGGRNPERWGQYGDCFSVRISRPVTARGAGQSMGSGFRLLLGFHVLYSKVLLHAAAKRLLRLPKLKPV
jgi:hypothetical protein